MGTHVCVGMRRMYACERFKDFTGTPFVAAVVIVYTSHPPTRTTSSTYSCTCLKLIGLRDTHSLHQSVLNLWILKLFMFVVTAVI